MVVLKLGSGCSGQLLGLSGLGSIPELCVVSARAACDDTAPSALAVTQVGGRSAGRPPQRPGSARYNLTPRLWKAAVPVGVVSLLVQARLGGALGGEGRWHHTGTSTELVMPGRTRQVATERRSPGSARLGVPQCALICLSAPQCAMCLSAPC